MIDLSQFVGKKVRITLQSGIVDEGLVKRTLNYDYPFSINLNYYSNNGEWKNSVQSKYNIIEIEEIKPMIDLSKFVDKQVRVTFLGGENAEGKITLNLNYSQSPYLFSYFVDDMYYGRYYNSDGIHTPTEKLDIIHIEEIKPMNRYEELEKQVAEMQKEIDRLKREEKKYPDLKPVEVIRTVRFTPEEYFKHCEENEFEVTEEGYEEFYTDPDTLNDCFFYNNACTQEIKVMEN